MGLWRTVDDGTGKTKSVVRRCRLRVEGGQKLEVRGFIGISLFGRTQVWLREQKP